MPEKSPVKFQELDAMERAGMLYVVNPGPKPEANVSNREFLDSLVRFGCWLRVVSANESRSRLSDRDATDLERYSAIASFYEHAGMLLEDIFTALVTWPAWSHGSDEFLADLSERLILSPGQKPISTTRPYHEEVLESFVGTNKRIRVNPGQYAESLFQLSHEDCLRFLGIPWKKHPSVKTVARKNWDRWHNLPSSVVILQAFISEKSELVSCCYNKLKHGPQAIVTGIQETYRRRGWSLKDRPDAKYLRLLTSGAETQKNGELNIAPFLLHDQYFVNAVFYERLIPLAHVFWMLSGWLFSVRFATPPPDAVTDRRVKQILRERASWEAAVELGQHPDPLPYVFGPAGFAE